SAARRGASTRFGPSGRVRWCGARVRSSLRDSVRRHVVDEDVTLDLAFRPHAIDLAGEADLLPQRAEEAELQGLEPLGDVLGIDRFEAAQEPAGVVLGRLGIGHERALEIPDWITAQASRSARHAMMEAHDGFGESALPAGGSGKVVPMI